MSKVVHYIGNHLGHERNTPIVLASQRRGRDVVRGVCIHQRHCASSKHLRSISYQQTRRALSAKDKGSHNVSTGGGRAQGSQRERRNLKVKIQKHTSRTDKSHSQTKLHDKGEEETMQNKQTVSVVKSTVDQKDKDPHYHIQFN